MDSYVQISKEIQCKVLLLFTTPFASVVLEMVEIRDRMGWRFK